MAKYILAVSGGVDSMVMLDIFSKSQHNLIIAHVDHGIRGESAADRRFVEETARQYGLPCLATSLFLGKNASEELARNARYEFLFEQAKKFGALIATAHHQDDLIGSVAINLRRSTGWRGLAVMDRQGLIRPLLHLTKRDLYDYALKHRLEWVEDSTNRDGRYLRNRLRAGVLSLSRADKNVIVGLRSRQLQLKKDISREALRLIEHHRGSRYFYASIDEPVAVELLKSKIERETGERFTDEIIRRLITAIKVARSGTKHDVASGVSLEILSDKFIVHKR